MYMTEMYHAHQQAPLQTCFHPKLDLRKPESKQPKTAQTELERLTHPPDDEIVISISAP